MPVEGELWIIIINGFDDLMPHVFTGDNVEIEIEEFLINLFNGNNCMQKDFIIMLPN